MKFPTQNRSAPAIFVVLAFGLSAVYFIPYLVPVHEKLSRLVHLRLQQPGSRPHSAWPLQLASRYGLAVWGFDCRLLRQKQ